MTESVRLPDLNAYELDALLDLTPMPVRVVDLSGRVVRANASALQEYGDESPATLRDLWERRAARHTDRDDRVAYVECAGMRALAGHTTRGVLTRVRDANGDERILATHAAPMRDADQRVTGTILIDVDVTDRHRRDHSAGVRLPSDAVPAADTDDGHGTAIAVAQADLKAK